MSNHATIRTPWQVMRATILALSIRYIQHKFILNVQSRRTFGFIAVFTEPLTHILIWMFLNRALSINTLSSLPQPLFILIGAASFIFTRNVIRHSTQIIKKNKQLFNFRQVRPIDPIIAMVSMELMINAILFILFLVGFLWIKIDWHMINPSFLILNTIFYVLFLFGLALIISIASFFLSFMQTLINMLIRVGYMLSGVFFTSQMIPDDVRHYFYINPLFQYIEILRTGFSQPSLYSLETSSLYLFKTAIFSLLFGLSIYMLFRNRIMVEIKQR